MTDEEVLNDVEQVTNGDLASLDLNNLPSDPEELLKLLNGADATIKVDEQIEDEDENSEGQGSSPEPPKEDEAPILSADGKHQIPYSVLRRERDARQAMEAENAALQKQIEDLKQQTPGEASPRVTLPELDPEDPDIKALEEEFPEIAKLNQATRAENLRLRQEMEALKSRSDQMLKQWESEQVKKQQAEVDEVNTQIDANPVLRYLRAEGDEKLWSAAVEIDQRLRNSPVWADKPMADRFAKVVERLEEDFGPVKLPADYQSPARTTTANQKQRRVQDDDTLTINTLSDLKGGSSPDSSGVNAENMTAAEIGEYFLKMDPSQLSKMDPTEILRRL